MPTADELLAALVSDKASHEHPVVDDDTHFIIDPETRVITNAAKHEIVVMQFDHNSERYTFQLPRYIDGHDMTLCNRVRVHFNNIDGKTGLEIADVAEMTDLQVDSDNPDMLTSSWLISRHATQLVGVLSFLVQYMCVADDGTVTYEWHTDIFSDARVKQGRNNSEAVVVEYSNILDEWYERLFGTGESAIASIIETSNEQQALIVQTGEAQKAALELSKEKALSAITSKGEEILATIPDDYTTTYNMANKALRTRANAIVQTAEGESITATDCSNDYLRSLHIYGKTTQTKTSGNQLFDVSTKIENGFVTVDSDGVITVDCDNTANTSSKYATFYTPVSDVLLPNTTYAIVFEVFYSSGLGENVYLTSHYSEELSQFVDTASISALTVGTHIKLAKTLESFDSSKYMCRGFMTVPAGVHVKSRFRVSVVANTDVTADTFVYEPYSGGFASPSIDWQQGLNSIENPSIYIYGSNFANAFEIEKGANTSASVSSDGYTITCVGGADKPYTSSPIQLPMDILRGKTVILEADSIINSQDSSGKGGNVQLNIRDSINMKYVAISPNNLKATTTIPEDVERLDLNIYTNNSATLFASENTTVVKGLRLAIVDTEWNPYEDEQSITVDRVVRGIPVTSNGNYTDSNDQHWICDEVDFERGVYIQRILDMKLTGTETITRENNTTWAKGCYVVYTATSNPKHVHGEIMCSFLPTRSNADLADGKYTSGIGTHGQPNLMVKFSDDITTLEGFKTAWADAIAAGGKVYAILETPVEVPLTDEELFAFSQLRSNYLTTTVLNDAGAYVEFSYNADTKTYFNNTRGATDAQVQAAVDAYLAAHYASAEEVAF